FGVDDRGGFAEGRGEGEGGVGLAAAGNTLEGDAGLECLLDGTLELELGRGHCHHSSPVSSRSMVGRLRLRRLPVGRCRSRVLSAEYGGWWSGHRSTRLPSRYATIQPARFATVRAMAVVRSWIRAGQSSGPMPGLPSQVSSVSGRAVTAPPAGG